MKKIIFIALVALTTASCNNTAPQQAANDTITKDTLTYPFKATYSSDITVPGNPVIAQKVLQVWKMFETMDIQAMKPYFADSVYYDDASGMHFYGKAEQLLAYAKQDVDGLDSMRFDISMWQCAHINDKNEDWVNIWATERRYPKKGKPVAFLMQENWQVKDGKVARFNQYTAKP
ncbi:MAG TPA: nuclear transport factor 2 family protein [Chitinophagaceae bacterium]|jgi:hypothetical protein